MHTDRQTCCIHHHEHRRQPAIFFADEIADGVALIAKLHDAGRARHDAELVFKANANDVVAGAERAVGVDEVFWHQKKRYAARSRRRIGQAREHEVDDIFGHLVVAEGDEYLGAADAIVAIGVARGFGGQSRQIRASVRLGQVHGAGPFAGNHVWQVGRFERVAAAHRNGIDGALGQQRAQPKR